MRPQSSVRSDLPPRIVALTAIDVTGDNDLEDVLWEMDTNHDFRIAQLKVYQTA
jgi:hypothetical protein